MAHMSRKTTTSERILYYCGASHKMGESMMGGDDDFIGAGAGARYHDRSPPPRSY